ncbi:MAG: hydrogenase maturation protease [Betaproteobacteria bacterium]|nr:hydrogenase maturation protease [Betaproteobacteria bacterium]
MAARIICVGNRYAGNDDFGPRVYDCLAAQSLPADVDVVDGGLAGLDLLRHLEDGRRVVFVDAVAGFADSDGIILLSAAEIASQCVGGFDHAAGLPYLLKIMPAILECPPPRVTVIGHEGVASVQTVSAAAQLALNLAMEDAEDACSA